MSPKPGVETISGIDFLARRATRRAARRAADAAVVLKAPFETGKPYDFTNLGEVAGTMIIKKGGGNNAPLVPTVRYEVDVTKAVRAWATGEKPNGLASRIVPKRAVDEGWTVNFNADEAKPPELVVTTFTAK